MSVSEQILHVQDLWDRIASQPNAVAVPDWHHAELHNRLDRLSNGEATTRPLSEVLDQLRSKKA